MIKKKVYEDVGVVLIYKSLMYMTRNMIYTFLCGVIGLKCIKQLNKLNYGILI